MGRLVKVLQAGRLNYGPALRLQQALANKHLVHCEADKNIAKDTLIMVEHEPVYTVGIRDKSYSCEDEAKLRGLGAEFYRTNRGGLITYHGPGQLVVYPILDLKHFKPSIRWYVSQIEQTVIAVCKEYNLRAETSPYTGVWVGDKKICAIGIHGSRFITTHGLALNCETDLNWFSHIVPCGIEGKGVTSLSEQLQRTVTIEEVVPVFLFCFSKIFNCSVCNFPKHERDDLLRQVVMN
ncbi:octanoyl-[acyl-carrier-protein]:protein N-octanoyltransferase LIPT2, mitochondrial isoform X1 [Anabrus simplex]|uniref:octanoyl-[acyl-carrier-protein]:protein N-octanoyltransferase LIPT2, mitochondrial isoform X1 n=1 Tax=Anabrus simplex TaxID=316456 RepID=UPI0035A3BB78